MSMVGGPLLMRVVCVGLYWLESEIARGHAETREGSCFAGCNVAN